MATSYGRTPGGRSEHLECTAGHERQPDWHDCTVASVRMEGDVKRIVIEVSPAQSTPFNYQPGQWVDLLVPGRSDLPVGGYSFVSCPSISRPEISSAANVPSLPRAELAIKRSRHVTASWLHEHARVGTPLRVRVGGGFHTPFLAAMASHAHDAPLHLLLLAGGVGINPLYSMTLAALGQYNQSSAATPVLVSLLYSARTEEALLFKRELQALTSASHGSLNLYMTLTRGDATPTGGSAPASSGVGTASVDWVPGPLLHRGRVTAERIASAVARVPSPAYRTVAFVCGPPAMSDDLVGLIKSGTWVGTAGRHGAEDDAAEKQKPVQLEVHREKWW